MPCISCCKKTYKGIYISWAIVYLKCFGLFFTGVPSFGYGLPDVLWTFLYKCPSLWLWFTWCVMDFSLQVSLPLAMVYLMCFGLFFTGVPPFGLPYAHIPSTFSLLGHYPSFPVSSLFGELGERGLASLPPGKSFFHCITCIWWRVCLTCLHNNLAALWIQQIVNA